MMSRPAHPLTILLVVLLQTLLCLAPGAQAQDGVATDKAALVALYNATDGPNWKTSTNWLSNEDLASWHGVTTDGDGRVTRLELQENGLSGTLPTELENLTHLESLLLDRNWALTGPPPDGLRELSALATVDLSHTELYAPEDADFQTWLAGISFVSLTRAPTEESVIDVAVFYTPQAREAHDGHDQIKAKIDLMVTETNRAYTDSGVDQRINPVVVEEVAYREISISTDIVRLKDPSDGHMDEVHAIRDRVWADIVMLIRARSGGGAVTMITESTSHARNAFGLCNANSLTFVHELGHIMGLDHDRYEKCNASGCASALSADAYGYVNQRAFDENAPASSRWRTIMAYNSQCDRDGFNCQWLLRFSNPNQLYPDAAGDPLGVALTSDNEDSVAVDGPANAVRVLNETRDTVADFRQGRAVKVFFDAGPYSVTEGGTVTVTVRLDAAPGRTLNLPIPLTANSPDGAWPGDYAMPSSITFGSNQTEQTFSVTAVNDTVQEDEETVLLGFGESLPAGVTLGSQATATVTLTDNDTVAGAPSIAEIAITSEPGAAYAAGEEVEVTIIFTKPVTVTGTPGLGLTIGTTTRPMVYQDARSASEVLVFAYTVADGESDTDGVSIPENSLEGTIRDSANQDTAILTHAAVDADHTVDGVTPELDTAAADGAVVTLTFDEVLDETSISAADAFTVTAAGAMLSLESVEVSEMVVTLTLGSHVVHGQVVRLDYTPGTKPLQDLAGNAADPLSNTVVTNETAMPVYDTDHDGLIEITTLAQLDAMRHDLDGDGIPVDTGTPTYATAFPAAGARLTCGVDSGCAGYELTVDLDFDTDEDGQVDADDTYWNNGVGWVPIGTSTDPFATTFEGNGHSIRYLFIDRNTDYVGLFGRTEGRFFVIRHVALTNVQVTGDDYVGGLVGRNDGGLLGSYVTGQVSGHTYTGGLVGYNDSAILGSYATGQVSGHTYTGGLVGYNALAIVGSYATGRVSGSDRVGGGLSGTSGRSITASYATGRVSGRSNIGGLVGSFSGTIRSSYWDTTTSSQSTGDGGAGQSTATLQAPTGYSGIYADWNVDVDGNGTPDDPWDFGASDQYPVLKADIDGDGTASWQEFGHQLRGGPTLTAAAGVGQVALEWTAVEASHWDPAPAVTYTITRDDGATVEAIAENLSGLGYTDTDVTPGATYHYQVAASVSGGEAARSARVSVTVTDNTPPAVSTVAITSDPGTDGIYAADDKIGVTVTFSESVVVTGRPQLTLNVGGEDRTAEYEIGTGTTALLFAYKVDEDDEDDDGVSIAADQLRLNGGTITDRANNPAFLTHSAVMTQSGHRVDGVRPKLVSTGGAVANGETLTLTFDEPLDGSSSPPATSFMVTGGNASRTVTGIALSGSAVILTLDPAVEHGQTGIRVSYRVPTAAGASPLRDTVGNAAARLSNEPVTNETPDTTPPAASKLEISSDPGTDRTYAAGDEIRVTVTFSETVEVTGRPQLTLRVGSGDRTADYQGGTGTAALVFVYEVEERDEDTDGVSIEANRLTLNGGTIRDEADNDAVLDHEALAADAGHKVDGVKPELAASGGAVVNGTRLTLTYDETLDGSSRPETGDFTVSGGDQARTVSRVVVRGAAAVLTLDSEAEHEEAGIRVSYTPGANPIQDVPGNDAEALSREAVTNETPDTTSPTVSSVEIPSTPPDNRDTYAIGDVIEATVTFDETVVVTRTPRMRLRVGSRNRTAGYLRGTDTAALVFGYEVAEGDEDSDGVSVEAGRIVLNGGTIEDEAGNDAVLDHEAVATQAGHKVDGVRPELSSAAVDGASLTLTYGEALDGGSRPAPGDFTVEVDGSGRSVSGVSVSGSVVTLFLNPAVEHGDTGIRVSYTPGTNPIRDAVGNDALGLSSQSVTNTTGAPNTAPEITSPSSFDVPENRTVARRLAARDTDPGDEVTGWAIVGGSDQGQFTITSDTGDLSFRTAPDYETPGDNEYEVRVEVRSGAGTRELEAEQTFTVRVTNEREPPGIPEAPTFSGGTAVSMTVHWSEPDNTGPAITDYDVRYREGGSGGFTDARHEGPGLSLTLDDLEPGTAYEVQVRATNDEGTSDWSESGEGMTVAPLRVPMTSDLPPPVESAFAVRFSFSEPVRGFTGVILSRGRNLPAPIAQTTRFPATQALRHYRPPMTGSSPPP